jgi:hypothetical protein
MMEKRVIQFTSHREGETRMTNGRSAKSRSKVPLRPFHDIKDPSRSSVP